MIHLNEQTGAFEPTLHILGGAMDEAWRRVKLTHLNGSANAARTVLAEHIFAMARQGERDPQRLIEGALISAHTLSLGQLRVSRSHRFHADVGRDALYAAPQASFAFGALCRGLINPSFHLGGGAGAKSTPQTGLRHISNRSRVCRNGNWKMASGDWRRKATSPEAKFQNLPARHSGAPA